MDWGVSTSGWNNYQDARGLGSNGAWPWGTRPAIDTSAEWIWSADAHNHNQTYFTTSISASAVPEPSSIFLMGLGFVGLMAMRKIMK